MNQKISIICLFTLTVTFLVLIDKEHGCQAKGIRTTAKRISRAFLRLGLGRTNIRSIVSARRRFFSRRRRRFVGFRRRRSLRTWPLSRRRRRSWSRRRRRRQFVRFRRRWPLSRRRSSRRRQGCQSNSNVLGIKQPPNQKIDLMFVIDRSGSIGAYHFRLGIKFIKGLLNYFSISPGTTRVAAVSYSSSVRTDFSFGSYVNRECVFKGLDRIRYNGGMTATGPALARAFQLFQARRNQVENSTRKVIFLMTDGHSNIGGSPGQRATILKNSGVQIFVLGIGFINMNELRSIASSSSYIFRVTSYSDLSRVTGQLDQASYTACSGQFVQFDECGRKCQCVCNKLTNCQRIRKEFTSMSTTERQRYIQAIIIASTRNPYKRRYDELIDAHRILFDTGIHQRPQFLPWHRWFILEYENLLREIDCRVTVPYWDWSIRSQDPWSSSHVWHTSSRGFGGNGPGCVTTGPFRFPSWRLVNGNCLQRNFQSGTQSEPFPNEIMVRRTVAFNAFNDFELALRVDLHDVVHCFISGTMCTADSASAPEFFLHHGYVDKIWADWQKRGTSFKNAYFPANRTLMQRLNGRQYYTTDFIDLQNQPGCVKASYGAPPAVSGRKVTTTTVSARRRRISSSRRRFSSRRRRFRPSTTSVFTRAVRVFRVSPQEAKRAKQLARILTA